MELWILEPARNLPGDDNPWEPWFDKSFGFIVRAETEKEARQIAHKNQGDEGCGEFLGRKIAESVSPWLDSKYSTCSVLTSEGKAEMIMQDFASA